MANIEGPDLDSPDWGIERPDTREVRLHLADRTAPIWAIVLGSLFSLATSACVIAMILLGIFLERTVVLSGETRMSFVLLALAFSLALAIALLEVAHAKALRGFRGLREFQSKKVHAILSAFLALMVLFIHPLAGLIVPIVSALGAAGLWYLFKTQLAEPHWVYEPNEAVSLLSGRDATGLSQSTSSPGKHPLSAAIRKACFWLAIGSGVAVGSYLVAERVLMPGIVVALTLVSAWNVDNVLQFCEALLFEKVKTQKAPPDALTDQGGGDPTTGLTVTDLTIAPPAGASLLSSITLAVNPGKIIGIIGESGAGKSVLLKAIADPSSISNVRITGSVSCSGQNLWRRSGDAQRPLAAFVQDCPIIVPASGAENLSCYQGSDLLERGKFFLEQLVFAKDLANEICETDDARTLPSMQRKALAIARAFAIAPQLYLFDRPEDALQTAQIGAFCNRLEQEARLGRSIVVVSDHRMILEKCDELAVMQAGSVTDIGNAADVRARLETGWHRFVAKRQLQTETSLEEWVRSHFRRNGDEANRKKVVRAATELLVFSCGDANGDHENIEFLFKNFRGYCDLKMQDASPSTSTAQIQIAQEMAETPNLNTGRNPLANVMCEVEDIEFASNENGRQLHCKIETYDPRNANVRNSA